MRRSPSTARTPDSPPTLPSLVFSPDARLCEERGVLSSVPETSDLESLRHAFLLLLSRDREDFYRFCASTDERPDYRTYDLRGKFGPFRAAFCERATILGTRMTVVFLGRSLTDFFPYMGPKSVYYASTVNRILFELLYLKHGGSPDFSALSPEVFLLVSRTPRLAQAIFSERCGTRCCDLAELLRTMIAQLLRNPDFASVKLPFEDITGEADPISDIPVEALVCALTSMITVFRCLASDNTVHIRLIRCGNVREIEFMANTRSLPFSANGDGLSVLFRLSDDFRDAVRIAVVLTELTHLPTAVYTNGTMLTLVFRIGAEPPPLLDFKYSDPIAAVPSALGETLGLLDLPGLLAACEQDEGEEQDLRPGAVRSQQEHHEE
ncbi:MAG: hypothetical protein K6A33_02370 [Clostridiales bacterium]|nr:hypothetical protein [Clostridiales bacterium]